MKQTIVLFCAAFFALGLLSTTAQAQRVCGTGIRNEKLRIEHPDLFSELSARRQKQMASALAAAHTGAAQKTTAQYPIPVVFHFILTPAQWALVGNDTGIIRRVNSQIKVLNADFNRKNADSSLIPGAFKSLYANVNIQFGLARGTNANTISPGIEVKVLAPSDVPAYDLNEDCYAAKNASTNGFPAWDVTKYLNVWVVNMPSGVIGITTPSYRVGNVVSASHTIGANEMGVVLTYGAVGAREYPGQYFIQYIDKGRTLTHETGHFFWLAHTWGDDGGLCPTNGGQDDDIADTPPEDDAHYCNSGVCPTFPKTDNCSTTSPGIMFMNYMTYVDDRAMQMFSVEQAAFMRTVLAQEYWGLTQNPQLLTGVGRIAENAFRVFPNPVKNEVYVDITGKEKLLSIDVVNMLGQSISHTTATNTNSYRIQLAGAARGIYFVHCRFAEGTLTKKIVLE